MDTKEEYLAKIIAQLEKAKADGKRGLFKVGEKIDFNVANYVKEHFKGNPKYEIDVHSCGGCKSKVWDLVILFKGKQDD